MTTEKSGQAAPSSKRPIRIEGGVAFVPLTQGYEAVIAAKDAQLVSAWNWCAEVTRNTVYAKRNHRSAGRIRKVYMHRVVMNAPDDLQVDHISGDGLDNRRSNLRLATASQNRCNQRVAVRNTSGFKGVYWDKSTGKWRAQIGLGGKRRNLGLFETPGEANAAYCAASAKLHGEFGRVA